MRHRATPRFRKIMAYAGSSREIKRTNNNAFGVRLAVGNQLLFSCADEERRLRKKRFVWTPDVLIAAFVFKIHQPIPVVDDHLHRLERGEADETRYLRPQILAEVMDVEGRNVLVGLAEA